MVSLSKIFKLTLLHSFVLKYFLKFLIIANGLVIYFIGETLNFLKILYLNCEKYC